MNNYYLQNFVGFLVLLSQLTDVGNVTKEQFLSKFL